MSNGYFTVKGELNEGSVFNKLNEITHNVGVMIDISQKIVEAIDPYVPCDTGRLSEDVDFVHSYTEGTLIKYNAPYASKCYYGDDIAFHKDKHPLATAHWDKVAMQTQQERVNREAEAILKARAKEVSQNG